MADETCGAILDLNVNNQVAVIILAAGLGKRMLSQKAKVLHEVQHRPMIHYVVDNAKKIATHITVVVGHQAEAVRAEVLRHTQASFAYQEKQLGTGHAVQCATPHISDSITDIIILCGDVPLLRFETILQMLHEHRLHKRVLTILATELEDPTGYGRIILDANQKICKIVEENDASAIEKQIKLINTGTYCVNFDFLKDALSRIKADNSQAEFYLTDIAQIANAENKASGIVITPSQEVLGVNTLEDLRNIEKIMQMQDTGNV